MPVLRADTHAFPDATAGNPREPWWISEAASLTQFGANVETLLPGERSSVFHWHSAEDEVVYILEGAVTLREGQQTTLLQAGDAAAFRAGVPVGHCLENRSVLPVRFLTVGTRAPKDTITYPEINRVCHRDRSLPEDVWTDLSGNPAACPFDA